MKHAIYAFLAGASLTLVQCRALEGKRAPVRPQAVTCQQACTHLDRLGCDEGAPAPGTGETCAQVCARALGSGYVDLPLACLASALTCEQAAGCR